MLENMLHHIDGFFTYAWLQIFTVELVSFFGYGSGKTSG